MNVVNAIRSLCAGKRDGVDDICSDNLHVSTQLIDLMIILSLYLIVYCRMDVYLSAFFRLL